MEDSWESGDHYDYFMGRWSRLVAREFIDWLSPSSQRTWLDIGCGSGSLSKAIVDSCNPATVTAVDRSEGFVRDTQRRLGKAVQCLAGDALALPVPDASVDYAVSGLVLNFISEPVRALTEMKRVTVPGGTAAVYVWDYSGKMEFLNYFWNAAEKLNPRASALHEGRRFPNSTAEAVAGLFEAAGFVDVEPTDIDIGTHFRNFEDFWQPFLGGQGPAPTYLLSLHESDRTLLRNRLVESLPTEKDGSIRLDARAWAVKGKRVQSNFV